MVKDPPPMIVPSSPNMEVSTIKVKSPEKKKKQKSVTKKRYGSEGSGCAITLTSKQSSRRNWRRPAAVASARSAEDTHGSAMIR